ncbi:MAG: glycosyltransferase family 2 protein [Chloroflexota bacterium]|jgi:putative glycosyltransferase
MNPCTASEQRVLPVMMSVVATLYRSSPYINEFYQRVCAVMAQMQYSDFEIVFVNDGSPDDSLAVATVLAKADSRVTIVDLSRNFGHHKAIMTGLSYAQGDLIYLLDSDLEEEPEWLPDFLRILKEQNADVVYGVQQTRKGGFSERLFGSLFYKLMDVVSRSDYPRDVVTARLMTRRYVDALLLHSERELFLVNIFHITGFVQIAQHVKKHSTSPTSYTLQKKLTHVLNAVTSYETPLVGIFYGGLFVLFLAFLYIMYLLTIYVLFGNIIIGWTSLVVSIWCVGGAIITILGLIGMYLSRIYVEIKQRPRTVIRSVIRY